MRRNLTDLTRSILGIKSLQKLFIKDCPHLVDILNGMARGNISELKEVQVMNCPLWRGSTWNHRQSAIRKMNITILYLEGVLIL